jgi:hypothetical protein
MGEDLDGKVRQWLEKSGFPLEMRVASALRRTGLEVRQGEYYTDPNDPDKRREIDVVTGIHLRRSKDVLVEIAIECKTSPTQPWVVFSKARPRDFERWPGKAVLTSEKARNVQWGMADMLSAGERVGYAIRPAFSKRGDFDHAYEAVSQAVSYGRAVTGNSFVLPDGQRPGWRVVLPCVVVEGQLIEVFLSPKCELQTNFVDLAVLEWRGVPNAAGFTSVIVLNASKVEELADRAAAWIRDVADRLEFNPQGTPSP